MSSKKSKNRANARKEHLVLGQNKSEQHALVDQALANVDGRRLASYRANEFVYGLLRDDKLSKEMKRPTVVELRRLNEERRAMTQTEKHEHELVCKNWQEWLSVTPQSVDEDNIDQSSASVEIDQSSASVDLIDQPSANADLILAPTAGENELRSRTPGNLDGLQEESQVRRKRKYSIEFEKPTLPPLPQSSTETMPTTPVRDPNKTELLALPKCGLVRSNRGTIEMVVQKNGRILTPHYNAVGILKSVSTSDGITFTQECGARTWNMIDKNGEKLNAVPIISLTFDKKGNLTYKLSDGTAMIMTIDGAVTAA